MALFATEFKTTLMGKKYRIFSLHQRNGFYPVNLPANAQKIVKALNDSDNDLVYERGGKFYAQRLNGTEIKI